MLQIQREAVRPGRSAAHAATEMAWGQAYAQAGFQTHWLGMTTITGPDEAWYMSGYDSFAAMEKIDSAVNDNPAMSAQRDKLAAADGDHVSSLSSFIARHSASLSYQADVSLPTMRYMSVDVVRVKPGYESQYNAAWRMLVAAHEKAKMNEHWAVYVVESGMADTTYLFFYPRKSLADVDAAGPMHGADFGAAVGETGRRQLEDMTREAVVSSTTMHFRLRPSFSHLPKAWSDADSFWAVPAAAPKK